MKTYNKKYRVEHKKEKTEAERKKQQAYRRTYLKNKNMYGDDKKQIKKEKEELRETTDILRRVVYRVLRCIQKEKVDRTSTYVEYTIEEAVEHFKKGEYTLEDYREGGFHVDHIIPFDYFVTLATIYKEKDSLTIMKQANSLENLRIIPAKENMEKSGRLDMMLVEEYNLYHLLLPREKKNT